MEWYRVLSPSVNCSAARGKTAARGLRTVGGESENRPVPTHTHPGEEFASILEGSVYLWEKGKGETRYVAGDSCKVSMGAVHKVRTGDESVRLVAFGVHTIGEPERTLVDIDH